MPQPSPAACGAFYLGTTMAASQPALFNVQEFTDNGVTLVGGRLYTYAFGTTALKVAYTDPDGTIPQTYTADGLGGQYIALDARGELPAPLYLASTGSYDISLKRADGSTVWTRRTDGVGNFEFAARAPTGSAQIGNGGESVAESFNALQLADYTALQNYTGPRRCVYVTGYSALAASPAIAGMFVADPSDTTSTTNGGTLFVASNGMRWKRQYSGGVDVRWWGAKFDYNSVTKVGTDDTAAIQACINYAQPLQKQILLPTGTAKITAQLHVAFSLFGLNMAGQGPRLTSFDYSGIIPPTNAAINIVGHSGAQCGAIISGVGFDGNAQSSGIVINGQDGQRIMNCRFGLNFFGGVFRNGAAGSFTEYCVFEDCTFNSACATAIWYSILADGDVSFHGSGLFRCKIETPAVSGYRCVIVDPRALPYNAPMDTQVWANAAGTFIYAQDRTIEAPPYFVGNVTTEAFAGPLILASSPIGKEIALVGKVCGNTPDFQMGSLFLVDAVVANASGSRQTVGGRVAKRQTMTTGANAVVGIPNCIMTGAALHAVNIRAPNYDYRYLVASYSNLSGGSAAVLANFVSFNSAGWGAPSFSIDPATASLVITNAAWPGSGVVATVEAAQLGQSMYDPFFN